MRIRIDSIDGLLGLCATQSIRAWMQTLELRVAYYDRQYDPALSPPRRCIYCFWHENILLPIFLRGHCNIVTLMSKHRDANILVRFAELMGFECVRGSSFRGGAKALKKLVDVAKQSHIAITPDGPQGPRRQMAPGPIFLAAKLGMPIVPMGFGYDRPWRMNSWDRFAIPRPFTRGRAVIGPAIEVPPDVSRESLKASQQHLQTWLTALSDDAEAWAVTGDRKQHEQAVAPLAAKRYEVATTKLHLAA